MSWREARRFASSPVVFGTTFSFIFVWLASDSFEWALAAAFMILVILHGIMDGVDKLLDELRKAGLIPPRNGDRR